MEFSEILKKRRSIRKFKPDMIPDNLVKEIVDAGRLAPSGMNMQPWRYIIVKSEEGRRKVSKAISSTHAAYAPVLIICCIDYRTYAELPLRIKELKDSGAIKSTVYENSNQSDVLMNEVWLKTNAALNAAISIEHMILKATDLGLGSCWLGSFDQNEIKKAAGLDDNFDISALVAFGYPDESPGQRPRLALEEIILKEM